MGISLSLVILNKNHSLLRTILFMQSPKLWFGFISGWSLVHCFNTHTEWSCWWLKLSWRMIYAKINVRENAMRIRRGSWGHDLPNNSSWRKVCMWPPPSRPSGFVQRPSGSPTRHAWPSRPGTYFSYWWNKIGVSFVHLMVWIEPPSFLHSFLFKFLSKTIHILL